jgi:hypothetical protein
MKKIATATVSIIALTLAAHTSGAHASSVSSAPTKITTIVPVVTKVTVPAIASLKTTAPSIAPVVPKVTMPTITPVIQKASPIAPAGATPATFGSGTWQSVVSTSVNPVTGLHASTLSRIVFSPNWMFIDYIVTEGGTGLGAGQTGAGGLVIITGKDKMLGKSAIQLTETSEKICTGLGCSSYPTSLIGKTFTEQVSPVSGGVSIGGGAKWTAVP